MHIQSGTVNVTHIYENGTFAWVFIERMIPLAIFNPKSCKSAFISNFLVEIGNFKRVNYLHLQFSINVLYMFL